MRPAEPPGRLLERTGDRAPRGMTVHDRTRLIGRLRHSFRALGLEIAATQHAPRVERVRADSKPSTRLLIQNSSETVACG